MTALDLNLVRLFVAIYEARSVSLAAQTLNLTQPTVSYGLAKLRDLLQDQLFSRTRYGLTPTPRADLIYAEFVVSLRTIQQAVDTARAFDPATTKRRFVLSMSDIGEMVFLPPILQALQKHAPLAALEVQQVPVDDLPRRLSTGDIAGAVGNLGQMINHLPNTVLFSERYVCLAKSSHDIFAAPLTRERFAAARHVHVSSNATAHEMIEETLKTFGIHRRIMLEIGHFAILSHVLGLSDLVALVPARVARLFEHYEDLRSCDLPIAMEPFEVRLYWHENDRSNAANRWMRALVRDALTNLPETPTIPSPQPNQS